MQFWPATGTIAIKLSISPEVIAVDIARCQLAGIGFAHCG
jgi:hypothetical protein